MKIRSPLVCEEKKRKCKGERLTPGRSGCTPSKDASQPSLPEQHHHCDDDQHDCSGDNDCDGEPVEAENDISETFVLGRTAVCCLHLFIAILLILAVMIGMIHIMVKCVSAKVIISHREVYYPDDPPRP